MAQGNHKLSKAKKSAGSQKRKAVKVVKKTRKGNSAIENNKATVATTRAINRKNERIVAAKALNAGTAFFLQDIATKGNNEAQRQKSTRDKKQNKPTKLTERLQARLNKLK